MPQRDATHHIIRQALIKDGWEITDDPYVISYGERFLFIDLAARVGAANGMGRLIAATRQGWQIAVEIKEFRGASPIVDLEQAIDQYVLYQMLLRQVDPDRELYLAVSSASFAEIFSEPIGELVIRELPLRLIIVETTTAEVMQ
jgi:hypothetical protein